MPVANDPTKPEFYVYRLVADGVPFYVGVGRSARASDRVRFVRYLLAREAEGKPTKWSFNSRVVAKLLEAGCDIRDIYTQSGLTRAQALTLERQEIENLVTAGAVLANIQHNTQRQTSPDEVVQIVLSQVTEV